MVYQLFIEACGSKVRQISDKLAGNRIYFPGSLSIGNEYACRPSDSNVAGISRLAYNEHDYRDSFADVNVLYGFLQIIGGVSTSV